MRIEVEMNAFLNGEIRVVEVPDEEWAGLSDDPSKLERIFFWGQNDFQPKPFPSVSVGDVVRLGADRWIVEGVGWRKL